MRLYAVLGSLFAGAMLVVPAQAQDHGDVAANYQWVHSNTQPGECGCFGLNGGGVSASLGVSPHVAGVLDFSAGHQGHGPSTGNSLTLVSYMTGGRYYPTRLHLYPSREVRPFAQVLAGGAHAGGGIAGAGDGTYAFALRAGGGLDLPLSRKFSLRLVQAEYYLTRFANTTNNHQNNFLIGAGAVYRF